MGNSAAANGGADAAHLGARSDRGLIVGEHIGGRPLNDRSLDDDAGEPRQSPALSSRPTFPGFPAFPASSRRSPALGRTRGSKGGKDGRGGGNGNGGHDDHEKGGSGGDSGGDSDDGSGHSSSSSVQPVADMIEDMDEEGEYMGAAKGERGGTVRGGAAPSSAAAQHTISHNEGPPSEFGGNAERRERRERQRDRTNTAEEGRVGDTDDEDGEDGEDGGEREGSPKDVDHKVNAAALLKWLEAKGGRPGELRQRLRYSGLKIGSTGLAMLVPQLSSSVTDLNLSNNELCGVSNCDGDGDGCDRIWVEDYDAAAILKNQRHFKPNGEPRTAFSDESTTTTGTGTGTGTGVGAGAEAGGGGGTRNSRAGIYRSRPPKPRRGPPRMRKRERGRLRHRLQFRVGGGRGLSSGWLVEEVERSEAPPRRVTTIVAGERAVLEGLQRGKWRIHRLVSRRTRRGGTRHG